MTTEGAALKIAFCGEISSGKSTALQTILRKAVIPDYFGSENRPTVRIVLGAKEDAVGYVTSDGTFKAAESFADIDQTDDVTELFMALKDTFGLGRSCELVEISPFRDGHVDNEQIAKAAECSVMVWTTIGSQAWRLSEKTILDDFGTRLPKTRILVATRSDKFRSDKDLAKLQTRLERETADYFKDGHLLGVPPSLFSTPDDEAAWAEAGGTEFVELIAECLANEPDEPLVLSPTDEVSPEPPTKRRNTKNRMLTRVSQALQRRTAEPEKEQESIDTHPSLQPETEVQSEPNQIESAPSTGHEAHVERETIVEEEEADPLAALVGSAKGIIAIGLVNPEEPEAVDNIFGETDAVETFGKFCLASAKASLKLAAVEDEQSFPEQVQIVSDRHSILFQTSDSVLLFLAGDASSLTPGIARTLLNRVSGLYDANELAVTTAA